MSGYVTGAMFIMSISARYSLRGREREVALRSFLLSAQYLSHPGHSGNPATGDSSAYEVARIVPVKLAAMEGDRNRTRARAVSSDCPPQQVNRSVSP